MKRIAIATIIIGITLGLVGCSNSAGANNNGASNNINTDNNKITLEQAKEIALKDSNLTIDEVSFIRADKDIDDGVEKYDIEFYHGNKEYDYEINAADGKIMDYDSDIENYSILDGIVNQGNTAKITEEQAKEIALNHANLNNEQVNFEKVELDKDDGVQKYEVEFHYNNREYNYEIDANTGDILSFEQD